MDFTQLLISIYVGLSFKPVINATVPKNLLLRYVYVCGDTVSVYWYVGVLAEALLSAHRAHQRQLIPYSLPSVTRSEFPVLWCRAP